MWLPGPGFTMALAAADPGGQPGPALDLGRGGGSRPPAGRRLGLLPRSVACARRGGRGGAAATAAAGRQGALSVGIGVQLLFAPSLGSPRGRRSALTALFGSRGHGPGGRVHVRPASGTARRRTWLAVAAFGGFALVSTIGLGVAAVSARDGMQLGLRHAERGLSAAEFGDQEGAAQELDIYPRASPRPRQRPTAPWAWPARAVPVLGHYAARASSPPKLVTMSPPRPPLPPARCPTTSCRPRTATSISIWCARSARRSTPPPPSSSSPWQGRRARHDVARPDPHPPDGRTPDDLRKTVPEVLIGGRCREPRSRPAGRHGPTALPDPVRQPSRGPLPGRLRGRLRRSSRRRAGRLHSPARAGPPTCTSPPAPCPRPSPVASRILQHPPARSPRVLWAT